MSQHRVLKPAPQRVALVAGGNRGIGFEICRQLGARSLRVVLTARDSLQGREAAGQLRNDGGAVEFHQLDVTNETRCAQ